MHKPLNIFILFPKKEILHSAPPPSPQSYVQCLNHWFKHTKINQMYNKKIVCVWNHTQMKGHAYSCKYEN